jgi:hypothetical protein
MSLYAKLWTDILGDPKLMRAARKGAKYLDKLPWLLAFAKEADDDGRLTVNGEAAEPADIAGLIPGGRPREIAGCIRELLALGILVEDETLPGVTRFLQWERRSGHKKPSDTPAAVRDRVKRYRDRKRLAGNAPRNAGGVTPGNAGEIDVDVTDSDVTDADGGETQTQTLDTPRAREDADAVERQLLERLGPHGEPVLAFLDTRPQRARLPWVGRISAAMDKPPHYEPEVVAVALQELLTGTGEPMPLAFRAFCKRIREERAAVPASSAGNGQTRSKPLGAEDAGAILSTIRSLKRKHQGPNGASYSIRKADVQALGDDVLAAYERIGGAERILETTGEYYGALKADFARELATARTSEPAHV